MSSDDQNCSLCSDSLKISNLRFAKRSFFEKYVQNFELLWGGENWNRGYLSRNISDNFGCRFFLSRRKIRGEQHWNIERAPDREEADNADSVALRSICGAACDPHSPRRCGGHLECGQALDRSDYNSKRKIRPLGKGSRKWGMAKIGDKKGASL